MDFNLYLRNMNISRECSIKMISFIRNILPNNIRLKPYFEDGSIRFMNPTMEPNTCFRLEIGEKIELSIAIATDRMGNRAEYGEVFLNEGTQYRGNPTIVEIMLIRINLLGLEEDLDYYGDIKSFVRVPNNIDEGYSDLIDEILRIRRIVYGISDEEVNLTDNDEGDELY